MKFFEGVVFFSVIVLISVALFSQKVENDSTLEVFLEKSGKYVGVEHPHNLGYDGDGIRVAVIDTGVDYNHPDLFGFGPQKKIIGGFDFVENDKTPLDTNGHGTEVAGIIAADGNIKGISPKAKILAYRVSDTGNSVSSDLIVRAINMAIEDRVDIINISLGVNRTNDKIEDAINDAVKKGIVVVAAAGNSGPDLRTIGSPGRDPNVITVGSTYNNITSSLVATLDIDGKRFQVLPMVGTGPIKHPIISEIIFGKYGRESDLVNVNTKNKILLIERGSEVKDELVYFSQKEKNSARAGAKAVIIYNNEPGIFLGDLKNKLEGPEYQPQIPVVSISKEDGLGIRAMLENKTKGAINTFYHPDFVSFFSSRGPVSPFYIKPDVVAPGVFVNTTSIHGNYNLTSGTSFAAPHVSGAVAILLQKNPSLTPQQIISIISTTADPVSDTLGTFFPQEVSGSGRLNITKAFDANLIIVPHYAIFNLSPFIKEQEINFELTPINGEITHIASDVSFGYDVAKFQSLVNGTKLKLKVNLIKHDIGQYQGILNVYDKRITYHIPILLRISNGSVSAVNNNGYLEFNINSEDNWSYSKISVYNTDSDLVDSISITPTKKKSISIQSSGTYWIQADVKSGHNTTNLYNSIIVKSTKQGDIFDVGLPQQQIIIIFAIMMIVCVIGLIIRKK